MNSKKKTSQRQVNSFESLMTLEDTQEIPSSQKNDITVENNDKDDEKKVSKEIPAKKKKKFSKYNNRRWSKKEKAEYEKNLSKPSNPSSSSSHTKTFPIPSINIEKSLLSMEKDSDVSASNTQDQKTSNNINNNNKKKKYVRSLQQCKSKECHGRIYCRDLQSAKMQAKNVLWPEDFNDFIGKKRKI